MSGVSTSKKNSTGAPLITDPTVSSKGSAVVEGRCRWDAWADRMIVWNEFEGTDLSEKSQDIC